MTGAKDRDQEGNQSNNANAGDKTGQQDRDDATGAEPSNSKQAATRGDNADQTDKPAPGGELGNSRPQNDDECATPKLANSKRAARNEESAKQSDNPPTGGEPGKSRQPGGRRARLPRTVTSVRHPSPPIPSKPHATETMRSRATTHRPAENQVNRGARRATSATPKNGDERSTPKPADSKQAARNGDNAKQSDNPPTGGEPGKSRRQAGDERDSQERRHQANRTQRRQCEAERRPGDRQRTRRISEPRGRRSCDSQERRLKAGPRQR